MYQVIGKVFYPQDSNVLHHNRKFVCRNFANGEIKLVKWIDMVNHEECIRNNPTTCITADMHTNDMPLYTENLKYIETVPSLVLLSTNGITYTAVNEKFELNKYTETELIALMEKNPRIVRNAHLDHGYFIPNCKDSIMVFNPVPQYKTIINEKGKEAFKAIRAFLTEQTGASEMGAIKYTVLKNDIPHTTECAGYKIKYTPDQLEPACKANGFHDTKKPAVFEIAYDVHYETETICGKQVTTAHNHILKVYPHEDPDLAEQLFTLKAMICNVLGEDSNVCNFLVYQSEFSIKYDWNTPPTISLTGMDIAGTSIKAAS